MYKSIDPLEVCFMVLLVVPFLLVVRMCLPPEQNWYEAVSVGIVVGVMVFSTVRCMFRA